MSVQEPKPIVRRGPRKWTLEKVRALFATRNFELLETEIVCSRAGLRYRCSCGYEDCKINVDNFKRGVDSCPKCSVKKKQETNLRKFGVANTFLSEKCKQAKRVCNEERSKKRKERLELARVEKKQRRGEKQGERIVKMGSEYEQYLREAEENSLNPMVAMEDEELDKLPITLASERPRVENAPRWPDPKPRREDFQNLSSKEWERIRKASTPHARATRRVYERSQNGKLARWRSKNSTKSKARDREYRTTARHKLRQERRDQKPSNRERKLASRQNPAKIQKQAEYAKLPARKPSMAKYKEIIQSAYHALKQELSINGHCFYQDQETKAFSCFIPARDCDVHHVRPLELFKDGKKRKQKRLSACVGRKQLRNEIQRNTDDSGRLLLQLLCPFHHGKVTFTDLYEQSQGEVRRRWRRIAKLKMKIRRCQYEHCQFPDQICSSFAASPMFHFDHLFTKNNPQTPSEKQKIDPIAVMVRQNKKYTMQQILTEISKCRLVHAICHRRITRAQFSAGIIQPPKLVQTFEEDKEMISSDV